MLTSALRLGYILAQREGKPPMVGSTILHYQVLEKLGEGGMGVVYKARDTKLNRFVAVKILPPEAVADSGRKARFVQEARAASALNHPNIVTVHDIVSQEAGECIVMEFVDGRPLSQIVAGREARLAGILKIAAQIADAIAAAHAAGIIHRDLKPSNILVTETGLVKVLDFGLAKLITVPPGPAGATMTLPRTEPGLVVGTPGYMSPEQIRGQELDRRSDIFNFGLILYEMLAGARAFQGDTSVDVMSAILKEAPPDLPENVPAALRQIVAVCLEKSPVNRFESARDIAFALRALAAGTSLTGALPKVEAAIRDRVWKRALPLALAAASVAAIVFAALYVLRRPEPVDLSSYKYIPFATEAEPETNGAWSPDGKSIAYLKRVGKQDQLFVRSLNVQVPTRLTRLSGSGVYGPPFWSPQGEKIYYLFDSKLWSIGVAGGEPQLVMPDIYAAATLSPDGQTLAAWRLAGETGEGMSSLWISSPPTSPPRKYQPAPFEFFGPSSPVILRFSPDGSKIALSYPSPKGGVPFWLLDWPDGPRAKPRRLFGERPFSWPPSLGWFPDSRNTVMAVDGSLWLGDTKTGALRRMTSSEAGGQTNPSVSPDGRRIVFSATSDDYDIVEIPLDGSGPRPYLATSQREYSPSWSSAGDRLAYVTDRAGQAEVWLRSATGDWERPVVTQADFPDGTESRFLNVALSPDGTRVAVTRRAPDGTRIWLASASGGKPMTVSSEAGEYEMTPSWSPDSTSLAYLDYPGYPRIVVARVGSGERPVYYQDPAPLTPPAWSPDGRWIAYGSGEELTLISSEGKTGRKIPTPVKPYYQFFVLVWSPDSSTIYIASSRSDMAQLFAVDVRTGGAKKVADLGTDVDFRTGINYCLSGSFSPGGKSFLTSVRVYKSDLWILEGFPEPGRRRRP